MNRKTLLSTIWIFAVLNYLYCDVLGLMDAPLLRQYLTGQVNGMTVNHTFLLFAGVLMEISIAMVLLSRILPYSINRWTNVAAGIVTTLVQTASLFVTTPAIYYLFFSVFEIAATVSIIVISLRWTQDTNDE